jgi:hypothetical protein
VVFWSASFQTSLKQIATTHGDNSSGADEAAAEKGRFEGRDPVKSRAPSRVRCAGAARSLSNASGSLSIFALSISVCLR